MSFKDTGCSDEHCRNTSSKGISVKDMRVTGMSGNRRAHNRMFRRLSGSLLALCMMLGLTAQPALANPADEPSGVEMVGDVLIARPVGAAMTAVGVVAFVVSLPLSAAGGNIGQAAEKLVVDPARETFVRCLGCRNTGRYRQPKD
ncbi:MAG: hypothetical protein AAGG11_15060 [Pseudomonadota bacterium]